MFPTVGHTGKHPGMFSIFPEDDHNLSNQPVSVVCSAYSEEIFSHVHMEIPTFQFVPIALSMFCHCTLPESVCPHSPGIHPLDIYKHLYRIPTQSSPGLTVPTLSAFPHKGNVPGP